MRSRLLAALLTVLGASFGQTGTPQFEVASVKPAGPFVPGSGGGMRGGPGTGDPGRVTFSRATLSDLISQAYDVWSDQVTGPDWLNDRMSNVYTVTATMPPGTTKDEFRLMLRNLLEERFHLALHHETQARQGYELVVGPGGPKLKPWTPPTEATPSPAQPDSRGIPRPAGQGTTISFRMSTSGAPSPIRMSLRETMDGFCRGLGSNINVSMGLPLGSPQPRVVNKTGLPGIYEFTLEFAGSILMPGSLPPPVTAGQPEAPTAADPTEGAPNLFTAVEKQLGLKLQKVKEVPVDVLVIDRAEKVPTEN